MKVKIYTIILLLIISCEVYIVFREDKQVKNEYESIEVFKEREDEVTIGKVMAEINKKKDIEFMNIIMDNDAYLIRISVEGNKEEFINKIKDLDNFLIKDYSLEFNEENVKSVITLNYSTKGEF
ncbi:hypothetical protein ACQPU1_00945 [Clostridium paraputrificum]|uniref:hypothetical protein n=1 Tax=Clostridium TaxID=1485 RepID=UPI003D34BBAD